LKIKIRRANSLNSAEKERRVWSTSKRVKKKGLRRTRISKTNRSTSSTNHRNIAESETGGEKEGRS